MNRAVFVVRTANRPEILNRCLTAALDGCDVAQHAHWLVLDDSSPDHSDSAREIVQLRKRAGVQLAYIDKPVEEEIADSLPGPKLRDFFLRVVDTSSSVPTDAGRNLGLVAGLSLRPDVLFFLDDDMVHRHGENCFFHWCMNSGRDDGFIAAPRKLGISDMTYLDRLLCVLDRADWDQFVSAGGISSDPDSWNSPKNPHGPPQ